MHNSYNPVCNWEKKVQLTCKHQNIKTWKTTSSAKFKQLWKLNFSKESSNFILFHHAKMWNVASFDTFFRKIY